MQNFKIPPFGQQDDIFLLNLFKSNLDGYSSNNSEDFFVIHCCAMGILLGFVLLFSPRFELNCILGIT